MEMSAMPKSYSTNKQICERYGGVSYSTIWRRRKNDPRFPKPRNLLGIDLTDDDELDAYDELVKEDSSQSKE
jgi:hypothetical protein